MTAFSLAVKISGVFLRLFLSSRIGSAGMGLYQLIMSVYTMFSTFATAGITVSVSRLAAEKSVRSFSDAKQLLRNSFVLSVGMSLVFTLLMFFGSDFMAETFLREKGAGKALSVLALSMPFMAASACFKGWFIANSKIVVTSLSSLIEQAAKIAVIAFTLNVFMSETNDISVLCTGIVFGVASSEIFSFLWLFFSYFAQNRKSRDRFLRPSETKKDSMRSLLKVSVPVGLSVWVTSLLHTAEQLLIPSVLEKCSGDRAIALSSFGMIRGMVIPILFFPFAFLSSLVSVFTPDISRLNMKENKDERDRQISLIMSFSIMFSIAASGIFFFFPSEIGNAFYRGENTEKAIKILSAVTPFMYIETISDGMLKAIGEQTRTLRYSVYNSVLRLLLIIFLVSKTGDNGYLLLLVISNTFSFLLCYGRLIKVTGIHINIFSDWMLPLMYSSGAGIIASFVMSKLKISDGVPKAAAATSVYIGLFFLFCLLFSFPKIKILIGKLGPKGEKS